MQVTQGMTVVLLVILAMSAARADSTDPLFQHQSTLQAVLTAPLGHLVSERSESEYLPGAFSFKESDGTQVDLDVLLLHG